MNLPRTIIRAIVGSLTGALLTVSVAPVAAAEPLSIPAAFVQPGDRIAGQPGRVSAVVVDEGRDSVLIMWDGERTGLPVHMTTPMDVTR